MRIIDADALIAWIKGSQQMTSKMKCVIAKIETMPDAVSVVHGEWIKEGCAKVCEMCNQCGFVQFEGRVNNYCPNCGAKMDKERKGKCKECWYWSEVYKRCENKCGCQFKPYEERKESER